MSSQAIKVCPSCDGSGQMEFDSYDLSDITSKPKTIIRKCKRCDGTGKFQEKKYE